MSPDITPVSGTQPVDAGDGSHVLCRRFRLEIIDGPDKGGTFTSRGARTVIGSKNACDMVLNDPTVSRFHCEILIEEGRAQIRDLESRNGTSVDGIAIRHAWLDSERVVSVGKSKLRFELTDEHVKVPLSSRERFGGLVGRSNAMRALFAVLERAASSDATVLLEGETGTGKERAAEALHQEGPRQKGPLVVVDVGALPATLIESELFGHKRGAFTGAVADRKGAFEQAQRGTVYLDEVGDLPLELQPKLLRVLDRGEVTQLGASAPTLIDVRVIASTRRNLELEVNAGRFRSDLYFRLAVLTIRLPPLRERRADLELLVRDVLAELGASDAMVRELLEPERAAELARHGWAGNVRELRNHLERCCALESPVRPSAPTGSGPPTIDAGEPMRVAREKWVAFFERAYLKALLDRHGGNVAAAARACGMNRVHLHRLLARAGLR